MEMHPLCRILPEMTDAEFRPLVADIRAKGLMRPIVLFEGKILDGRHRFRACAEAGVEPRFEQYTGSDPVGFVQSSCMHRSLSATQRALVAAGFLEYEREQARKRMESGVNQHSPVENLPQGSGKARDKAGSRMGVSGKSVTDAEHVMSKAVPEVVEKLKNGEMALNEAKRIVELNPSAQRNIAALPKKERHDAIGAAHYRRTAARARDTRVAQPTAPGTPFVRTFLSGVERLAIVCAEQRLDTGSDIAAKFLSEMDWNEQALVIQLERCEPMIRALAIIQQRRASLAA